MINKAILVGHLGDKPKIGETDGNHAYMHFSVATSESWKDKSSGEKKERTEWHRVVAWGNNYRKLADYLKKGSKVMIEGKISTRSWDKDGEKRYTTEIVVQGFQSKITLLDKKENSVPDPSPDQYGQGDSYATNENFGDSPEAHIL